MQIEITRWPNLLSTTGLGLTVDTVELFNSFSRVVAFRGDREHGGWSPAVFQPCERKAENVRAVTALALDYDGGETLEGAGLQDTLIFAMKREEESVDFYRKMAGMMREEEAKELCANLANEELGHKKRLETLYDQLFYEGE